MKRLEEYLTKTGKHLFKFTPDEKNFTLSNEIKYMKIILGDKTFRRITFDENLEIIKDINFELREYRSISHFPNNKEYIDPFLRKYILFHRGQEYSSYKISSIKHFKKFNEIWDSCIDEIKEST